MAERRELGCESVEERDVLGQRDDGRGSAVLCSTPQLIGAQCADRSGDRHHAGRQRTDDRKLPLGHGRQEHEQGFPRPQRKPLEQAREAMDALAHLGKRIVVVATRGVSVLECASIRIAGEAIDDVTRVVPALG
jgi:hypothetical protein